MKAPDLWRPTDPEFIRDPYPIYRRILEETPIFQAKTGDYVVMSYPLVKQVLLDVSCISGSRRLWVKKISEEAKSKGQDLSALNQSMDGMLIQLNPPEHTELRRGLMTIWPKTEILTKKTEAIAKHLVSKLPTELDLVEVLSRRLPLLLISDLLGIDYNQSRSLAMDGYNLVQLLDPYLSYKELLTIEKSSAYLREVFGKIYTGSNHSSETFIYRYKNHFTEAGLDSNHAISLLVFLFVASYETTSSLLSRCLIFLLQNRVDLNTREDVKNYVKEILRVYNPVQLTGRVTTTEITLADQKIPSGSTLTLCLASANRDPRVFDKPDEVRMDSAKSDHLSFGYGLHHCLGHQLAQLEAVALIEQFFPISDSYQLKGMPILGNKLTIRSIKSAYITKRMDGKN